MGAAAEVTNHRPIPENLRLYFPSGEPCFDVPSADGKKRIQPTIAHVRKLGLVPSVTTILRETLASPTLVQWREKNAADAMYQAIVAQMTAAVKESGLPDIYPEKVWEAWRAELDRRSAEVIDPGKAVHAAVEMHFRGEAYDEVYGPWVVTARTALEQLGEQAWTPEVCIPTTRQYGGRCDIACDGWVIDIKTRQGSLAKVKPYDSECPQLAAYAAALGGNRRIANLFLSRDDPAEWNLWAYTPEQQAAGLAVFDHLHATFRLLRGLA